MAERTLITETATIQSNIYFTEYIIAPESNVRIWLLNDNGVKVLELKEVYGELLNSTEFNVDRNRGTIFFFPELIGNTVYIEYFTDLVLNPLFVYDELYRLAYDMARYSYMSVSGCFIKYNEYTGELSISDGVITFNNKIYTFTGASAVVDLNRVDVNKGIIIYFDEPLIEQVNYNVISTFNFEIYDLFYKSDGTFDQEYNLNKAKEYIIDLKGSQYLYLFVGAVNFIESKNIGLVYYDKTSRVLNLLKSSIEKNIRISTS